MTTYFDESMLDKPREVLLAANTIGYALEGFDVSPEAVLEIAQRLEDQGLLARPLTPEDEAEDATWT